MKKLILICFLIMFLSFISGICEQGQIDINSASVGELDEIYGIGPVKAQAIIDTRPFEFINDLINVWGIGETTLESILNQGLACVDSKEYVVEKEPAEELVEITQETIEKHVEEEEKEFNPPLTPEVISLTPKDIKSEENIESLDKTNYVKYGFIGFCILIGVLLILKNKKKSQI